MTEMLEVKPSTPTRGSQALDTWWRGLGQNKEPRDQGLWFMVYVLVFKDQGLWFIVQCLRKGLQFRVQVPYGYFGQVYYTINEDQGTKCKSTICVVYILPSNAIGKIVLSTISQINDLFCSRNPCYKIKKVLSNAIQVQYMEYFLV